MEIKCEKCKYLVKSSAGYWYCDKTKEMLENGFAMQYHAEHCGENQKDKPPKN